LWFVGIVSWRTVPVKTSSPLITHGISCGSAAMSASTSAWSAARSALPGA